MSTIQQWERLLAKPTLEDASWFISFPNEKGPSLFLAVTKGADSFPEQVAPIYRNPQAGESGYIESCNETEYTLHVLEVVPETKAPRKREKRWMQIQAIVDDNILSKAFKYEGLNDLIATHFLPNHSTTSSTAPSALSACRASTLQAVKTHNGLDFEAHLFSTPHPNKRGRDLIARYQIQFASKSFISFSSSFEPYPSPLSIDENDDSIELLYDNDFDDQVVEFFTKLTEPDPLAFEDTISTTSVESSASEQLERELEDAVVDFKVPTVRRRSKTEEPASPSLAVFPPPVFPILANESETPNESLHVLKGHESPITPSCPIPQTVTPVSAAVPLAPKIDLVSNISCESSLLVEKLKFVTPIRRSEVKVDRVVIRVGKTRMPDFVISKKRSLQSCSLGSSHLFEEAVKKSRRVY